MPNENGGEETLDIVLDDIFRDPEDSQLPKEAEEPTSEYGDKPPVKSELTQNMIDRINTVRRETEKETLDRVAKESGYDSYSAMKKAQETKLIRDYGYDEKDLEQVLEPLLQKRLADDPRFKKLEEIEQRERDVYVNTQLAAINSATGQRLKLNDLPKETLDLWAKGIDLEQAYYATQGKTLLTKGISQLQNGTLNHLAPGSGVGNTKTRGLTAEEKSIYASIMSLGGYQVSAKDLSEQIMPN